MIASLANSTNKTQKVEELIFSLFDKSEYDSKVYSQKIDELKYILRNNNLAVTRTLILGLAKNACNCDELLDLLLNYGLSIKDAYVSSNKSEIYELLFSAMFTSNQYLFMYLLYKSSINARVKALAYAIYYNRYKFIKIILDYDPKCVCEYYINGKTNILPVHKTRTVETFKLSFKYKY